MSDAPAYVYLLWCGRPPARTLYCGWTTDVARRLEAHRTGRGARYTRSRAPLDLAAVLPMPDAGAARREEARIKALRRPQKLALVAALERAQVSASTSTSTTSSPSTPEAIVATGHERRQ